MTIILGIDPGISGAVRAQRGRYGSKLMPGQSASGKYPGLIDCGGGVYRKPFVWRNKQGRERSGNYYYVEANCGHCQKQMLQDRENSKKAKNAFCDTACKTEFVKNQSAGKIFRKRREHGEGHHVEIKNHTHPRRGRHNKVYVHTLVAEEKVGRLLMKGERVHHINCVKNDNRPQNLFVCASNAEHFKIHGSLNRCVAELMARGLLVFDEQSRTYQVKK